MESILPSVKNEGEKEDDTTVETGNEGNDGKVSTSSNGIISPLKTLDEKDLSLPRVEDWNVNALQHIVKEEEVAATISGTGIPAELDESVGTSQCDNIDCRAFVSQKQLKMCEGLCNRVLCKSCRCRGCITKDCKFHFFVCAVCFIGCRRTWQSKVMFFPSDINRFFTFIVIKYHLHNFQVILHLIVVIQMTNC